MQNQQQINRQKYLNDLIENLKIKNNIYHKDVIDAMFRQVHSTATFPFPSNFISANKVIQATGYDLGRNGYAYNDNGYCQLYVYTRRAYTRQQGPYLQE